MSVQNLHLRLTSVALIAALLLQPLASVAAHSDKIAPTDKTLEQFVDEEFNSDEAQRLKEGMEGLRQKTELVEINSFSNAQKHVAQWARLYKPAKIFWEQMPFVFTADLQNLPDVTTHLEALLQNEFRLFQKTGLVSNAVLDEITLITTLKMVPTSVPLAKTILDTNQKLKFQIYRQHLAKKLPQNFKKWATYQADVRKPISLIELTKFSGQDPESLAHEIMAFKAEGFKIKVKTIPISEYEARLEKMQNLSENETLLRVMAEDSKNGEFRFNKEARKEAFLHLKHEFGLLKGVSIASFKEANERRTPFGKITELGIAVATTAFVGVGLHQSLLNHQETAQAVNMVLPFLVSGADKMFFTYFQAPVSAFFGQGVSFKYEKTEKGYHTFDKNRLSFPLLVFLNSFILRWSMLQATTPVLDAAQMTLDFVLFWKLTDTALHSAARGLYSKAPLQMYVEKVREKLAIKRPYVVLGMMSMWQAIWSIVQLGDIYNWKWVVDFGTSFTPVEISLRLIMTLLAVTGLGLDVRNNLGYFKRLARKMGNKLRGIKEPSCEAWLRAEFEPEPAAITKR